MHCAGLTAVEAAIAISPAGSSALTQFLSNGVSEPLPSRRRDHQGAATSHKGDKATATQNEPGGLTLSACVKVLLRAGGRNIASLAESDRLNSIAGARAIPNNSSAVRGGLCTKVEC
jgi:hypothetical protein